MRFLIALTTALSILNAADSFVPSSLSCSSTVNPPSTSLAAAASVSTELPVSSNEEDKASPLTQPQNDDDTVEFPPPLSEMDRVKRAARFWSTAVPIVASYYSKMTEIKLRQQLLGEELTKEEEEEVWNAQHAEGAVKLADTITSLKGFYVKTAQIISSRQDLFPKQYTDALSGFTDNLDPMPAALAKAVVQQELLHDDEQFEDVFVEFDDEPLGAASVAQVHRAVLSDKYGGKTVAIKIQRPAIESKLMGDIANLKAISKTFRNSDVMPLDYYTVFDELERQLADEFDFVAEAVAMDRVYNSLARSFDGSTAVELPVVLPRPVAGLISRRVLVMDYLEGVPLSRAKEEMEKKGIDPDSPEAKLFGRNLLKALTAVFGRTILETGFFHADPHAGNIFVLDDGRIGLIDFGQVKQISGRNRETLAKVMVALDGRVSDTNPEDLAEIGRLALELGVEFKEDAKDEAQAAVAMWLFDGSTEELPGGYDLGELSPNSPVKELKAFPGDLVLVGRSTILIKGLADRLGIKWSLSKEWAPIAKQVLNQYNVETSPTKEGRVRFREVWSTLSRWSKGKAKGAVRKLPAPLRTRVAGLVLKIQDAKARRDMQRG